jgi:predicted dehydrogenase
MGGAIRTGVVGLGYFGSFHARHYAAHPRAELVGVVDADPGRARAAALAHGAEPFSDHRALIGRVDAVSVAVPTALHHRIAGELIDAGIHVLVEKPVTDTPETARDLLDRAGRAEVLLQVGHIERFSAAFGALRERVSHPVMIDCMRAGPWTGRAADVDVVLDLMIHDIDLALCLAGAPVESVEATGLAVLSPHIDAAEARIGFANGIVATLRASRVAPAVERVIRVHEADRTVVADLARRTLSVSRLVPRKGAPETFATETVEIAPRDALGAEIASFIDGVAARTCFGVDGRAGLDALVVADLIRSEIASSANRRRKPSLEN